MSESIRDKQARLFRLTHLLYRHPQGLRVREMADICGVSVRTIQRDLKALEEAGVPLWSTEEEEPNAPRYGILEGFYIPPLQLTLSEATALYLAARLFCRNADESTPEIAQAFAQLATVLPETLARALQDTIQDLAKRGEDRRFRHVLETLALGWATGRKVRIRYRAASRDESREYVIAPYLLEPGNKTVYVLARLEGHDDRKPLIVTFKMERMLSAQLLDETYEVPEDFLPSEVLRNAWGIIWNEKVEDVVLRFAPEVARRVDESVWHPSQVVEPLPDGGRLMRLKVSGTLEIEPWIKSWGAAVEVLEPASLRRKLAEEARRLAALYADEPVQDGGSESQM